MTATKGFITGAATTALDSRKADAVKLASNADGTPRLGVIGAFPNIVTPDASTAPMRIAIAGAGFATQRAAGDGAAVWTNDGSIFITVTKPGSQSWIVTVYAKHNDSASGDANSLPDLGIVTGVAAAVPVEVAIPAGATKIATVLIPSTATSTQSAGVVITNVYPMTEYAGGVVPLRSQAEEDAYLAPNGQPAIRLDTTGVRVRRGGVWTAGGPVQYRSPVTLGAFTNAFVSKAAVSLPKGTYDISGMVEVNHSTATAHIYDAQIYNLTDAVILASGQMYFIAGTLRLTLVIGDTFTLAAPKTIQLRVKFDGAEGTQLISAGQLRATEIGALL
jgi:hypothetical protein